MATTGNRDWAFKEAMRRAGEMHVAYAIYQHRVNTGDHIIRKASDEKPRIDRWQCIATVRPD